MSGETKEFKVLKDAIQGRHARRFNAALDTCDDETFMLNYIKILEYTTPKLQRVEHESKAEDNVINIVHSYKNGEDENGED